MVSNKKGRWNEGKDILQFSFDRESWDFKFLFWWNDFFFRSIIIYTGGAVAVAFVQLLASMLSGLLIDTVGRIPLLIISSVFMSLALASFGSYVYYEEANKLLATNSFDMDTTSVNSDWIPLLCVLVFTIAFSLGKRMEFLFLFIFVYFLN